MDKATDMKRKRSKKWNKGMTLVEVLVAVFIIAAVTGPIMAIFVQSASITATSKELTESNYLAQQYMERLYEKTYLEALDAQVDKEAAGGYYVSLDIAPSGTHEELFSSAPCYFHMIYTTTGGMLFVAPDGTYRAYAEAPGSVQVTSTYYGYAVTIDSETITGSTGYMGTAVIVNTVHKPAAVATSLTLDNSSTAAVLFATPSNYEDVSVSGNAHAYIGVNDGRESLVAATVSVYRQASDTTPVKVIKNIIQLPNGGETS